MAKKTKLNELQEFFISNNLHKSVSVLANATNLPELLVEEYVESLKAQEFKKIKEEEKPQKPEEPVLPDKKKNSLSRHKRGGSVSMTMQASMEADEISKNNKRNIPEHDGYANKFFEDNA